MTPEKKVKTKVKKVLDTLGAYHCSPTTGGYGASHVIKASSLALSVKPMETKQRHYNKNTYERLVCNKESH